MRKKISLIKYKLNRFSKKVVSPFVQINSCPIFILGNQKSGTSAIAMLLAISTSHSVVIDLPGMYEPVQTSIHSGKVKFDDFIRSNRFDFSQNIIKEPCLTFLYSELKQFFPQARFVIIVRDPRDNIRSILNRLEMRGDLENIDHLINPNISPEWQLVLDGRWLGLQGKTYIEMLSARWNRAADVYLKQTNEMFLVRYEDFIKDKVGTIERLARQLRLPRANSISDKVDIQYQARGNGGISWEDFFGLKNLECIEKICGSRMRMFGYNRPQKPTDNRDYYAS